ncbi:MAG: metal ABC transporter substrate-binding protein [Anaerolineae bacterium]
MGKDRVRRWLTRVSLIFLVLVMLGACGQASRQPTEGGPISDLRPVSLKAGEKLRVVATTNLIGNVVQNVGGDLIDLTVLMGIGVDPHTYVPTPADTAAIHDAHLILANGAGLEANLDKILVGAGGNAVHIRLSDGLELREATEEHDHKESGEAEQHVDPHVWFDVQNVIHWVQRIEQTLIVLDPDHADGYRTHAQAYTRQLEELDAWIVAQIATIPHSNRKLVTNHPAFGYFADRYGLEQVGAIYPISPSSEPSAQDIADLEDAVRAFQVPAIFSESTVNPKLAEQVAKDTGVKLVPLFTGSLGGPGSGAETYIAMMRYNVQAIVEALRGP